MMRMREWSRHETQPRGAGHTQKSEDTPSPGGLSPGALQRAQGCLLGQLAGDALGSLVEFQSPASIRAAYPNGVRELKDGGTWNTIAGQPTDDSEMALALARSILRAEQYDEREAERAYGDWLNSHPFDVGNTIGSALRGHKNPGSQANGALMRVSPLGIHAARFTRSEAADWAQERNLDPTLSAAIQSSRTAQPADFVHQAGWVLIAFQNALYQLLHAPSLEEAIVETVMQEGDTDTNAAICGALLGAVYGLGAIPKQWHHTVLTCRPAAGSPGVAHPRPKEYWPVDALELAADLVGVPNNEALDSSGFAG